MRAQRVQSIAGRTAVVAAALLVIVVTASLISSIGGRAGVSTEQGNGLAGRGPAMMGSGMMGMMMGPGMMGMMGVSPNAPTSGAGPIPGALEVRVQAANFSFTPGEIRLPKEADVNLTLVNPVSTGMVHDLTVPGLGIRIVASAGETSTVGLRALPAGRYQAYCSFPGHADAGMRATVIVE